MDNHYVIRREERPNDEGKITAQERRKKGGVSFWDTIRPLLAFLLVLTGRSLFGLELRTETPLISHFPQEQIRVSQYDDDDDQREP